MAAGWSPEGSKSETTSKFPVVGTMSLATRIPITVRVGSDRPPRPVRLTPSTASSSPDPLSRRIASAHLARQGGRTMTTPSNSPEPPRPGRPGCGPADGPDRVRLRAIPHAAAPPSPPPSAAPPPPAPGHGTAAGRCRTPGRSRPVVRRAADALGQPGPHGRTSSRSPSSARWSSAAAGSLIGHAITDQGRPARRCRADSCRVTMHGPRDAARAVPAAVQRVPQHRLPDRPAAPTPAPVGQRDELSARRSATPRLRRRPRLWQAGPSPARQ